MCKISADKQNFAKNAHVCHTTQQVMGTNSASRDFNHKYYNNLQEANVSLNQYESHTAVNISTEL